MSGRRMNPEAEAARTAARSKKKFRLSWVAIPYCIYALIFILAPMVLVVVYAFYFHYQTGEFAFTFEYFARFWKPSVAPSNIFAMIFRKAMNVNNLAKVLNFLPSDSNALF